MPTAAASQEPVPNATAPIPPADDVEAALSTASQGQEQQQGASPVEIEAEQEAAWRWSSLWRFLDDRRQMSDFPFFVLGFAAVVSLVFIISDLMNKHTFHPISAGVFLLSSSYCIAIIRREWSGSADVEGTSGTTSRLGVLTKEARESLLTYFVFDGPTVTAEAEGKADQSEPQEQEQEQKRAEGKHLSRSDSTGAMQETRSSGGGTELRRENSSRKNGQESRGMDDSGSCSGMRDDRIGTDATNADSLPASTPAASPGPSSPLPIVPLEEQSHLQVGDGVSSGGGGGGDAPDTAVSTAVVASIGLDQGDGEDQGEGARRKQGSAPFDGLGLGLDVEVADAASSDARTALGDGAGKEAPETPETPETTPEPEEQDEVAAAGTTAAAPAAEDGVKGASGSDSGGGWSTDQSCIVCFGDYIAGDLLCRLPCRHIYHAKCIDEWLDRARLPCCPLCKTDLLASRPDDSDSNGNGSGTAAAGAGGGDAGVTGDNAV